MPRLSLLAVLVVALVGLVALGRAPGSAAQDGTPAAGTAGHPLVGAWVLDTDADDPTNPPTLASFAADGVYTQVDADGSVGLGAWEATGPDTADLTFHGLEAEGGRYGGMVTIRAAIEVAADGQTLAATYTLEFVGPEGRGTGQYGPGRVTGTKVGVEPMGTPQGPLSALEGQSEATPEATPGA
jgi:hypothetical protein